MSGWDKAATFLLTLQPDNLFEQRDVIAGLDQFGGVDDPAPLVEAVRNGAVPESRLDASVRRILLSKFQQGLFESPFVDPDAAVGVVGSAAVILATGWSVVDPLAALAVSLVIAVTAVRLLREHVEDQQQEDRPGERGAHQGHDDRAPVAQRVDDFLARDHRDARRRRCCAAHDVGGPQCLVGR